MTCVWRRSTSTQTGWRRRRRRQTSATLPSLPTLLRLGPLQRCAAKIPTVATSGRGGRTGSLDEGDPIATVRAADFAHHQMIARIHGADLDFLVRKDRDDAILDVDDHLLVEVGPLDRELLERAKIWLPAPGHGVVWVDMNR